MLGGGILGGAVQWRKSGAERDSIAATATKTAIEVFESSIKQLKLDLADAHAAAEAEAAKLASARKEMMAVVVERDFLSYEVGVLRDRIARLEQRIVELSS